MYRVTYANNENELIRDFEDLDKALKFAEEKYRAGWLYVRVSDEFENTIVEFEN